MNLTTLQDKVRYLLGELSSTQYSPTNLNRALNDYYHRAITTALHAAGEWEVNGEVATTDTVVGQQEYLLPLDLISLKRVEINFTGGDETWVVMNPIDMRNVQTALSNQSVSTDAPGVRIFDDSLFLMDYPDTAVTAGLKVYYSKESTELSDSDDEPGLEENTQTYLVYGACLDYSIAKGMTNEINTFKALLNEAEEEIKKVYSNRLPMRRPRMTVKTENYN